MSFRMVSTAYGVALAAAITIPGYFGITRAHDHYVIREQLGCLQQGGSNDDCGVLEKKLLYSERVWGSNKLFSLLFRDDFGEFLWSLTAIVPWAIMAAIGSLRRRAGR